MRILGIETSCDETAASVVEEGTKVLSNVVASSVDLHAKTGGIIPEQAARKQIEFIIPVIESSLEIAKLKTENLDSIALTVGPGLIGSLLVGVETAKTLAVMWDKPIIPVNHVLAHLYANWLMPEQESERAGEYKIPEFPAIGLVVSGGHTDMVLMKSHSDIQLLGSTRDDAAGEAFDKTARLLGLDYPGGPAIAAGAEKSEILNSKSEMGLFPRPLANEDTLDFSFSGLKTAVARKVKELESKRVEVNTDQFAAEVQEAIIDVLISKSVKAVNEYKPRSFLLAGGVSANQRLREKLQDTFSRQESAPELYMPDMKFTTDNAAMIASAAYFHNNPIPWQEITANPELSITD